MTNVDKWILKRLAKEGYTFEKIRPLVNCSDATIKRYINIFGESRDRQTG